LISTLRQWNLLQEFVTISLFATTTGTLQFLLMGNDLVFCHEINGLMTSNNIEHYYEHGRLYITSRQVLEYYEWSLRNVAYGE